MKELILKTLHKYSYNVESQSGEHLIVVDDDSWEEIAEELKTETELLIKIAVSQYT